MVDSKNKLLQDLDSLGIKTGMTLNIVDFIYDEIDGVRKKQEDLLLMGDIKRAMVFAGKSAGLSMVEVEIRRLVSELKKNDN